jgi:hypothetical protein
MAYTFSKLATVTVGAGGSQSISFTNIPQNYKDLCIVISARATYTGQTYVGFELDCNNYFNTGTYKSIVGISTAAQSGAATGGPVAGNINASGATANTFGNATVYIPNYSSSGDKYFLSDSVTETNATAAYSVINGFYTGVINTSGPIFAAAIYDGTSGQTLAQYSSATLYGIRAEV